jgi:3-oxoacyl-[acyl-carrier-protein] synthase II
VAGSFLLAARDAGCDARPVAPERTATFLGSGFGSLVTTAAYLRGVYQEGMAGASPTLFSESLASAPLGHAAIELDARGPSMAFTCGDVSMIAAVDEAWRAIRGGRIDRAICGAFELMPPVLVSLLARLGARTDRPIHIGEGAAAIVLEDEATARASGARSYATILGAGLAGDPRARPTGWSSDPAAWQAAYSLAGGHAGVPGSALGAIFRHAPPSPASARAEGRALETILARAERAEIVDVHRVVGAYAAAGGLAVAASIRAAGDRDGTTLVSAGSWGGATAALVISPGQA